MKNGNHQSKNKMLIYNITNSETTTAKPVEVKYEFFSVYCKNKLNIPKQNMTNPKYKRSHWTNEEILNMLEGMEFHYPMSKDGTGEKESNDKYQTYTDAINEVREIFTEFLLPEDSKHGAPMAYDTETGLRIHIGKKVKKS